MHFITNGYKHFSKTNLTDPRQLVPKQIMFFTLVSHQWIFYTWPVDFLQNLVLIWSFYFVSPRSSRLNTSTAACSDWDSSLVDTCHVTRDKTKPWTRAEYQGRARIKQSYNSTMPSKRLSKSLVNLSKYINICFPRRTLFASFFLFFCLFFV